MVVVGGCPCARIRGGDNGEKKEKISRLFFLSFSLFKRVFKRCFLCAMCLKLENNTRINKDIKRKSGYISVRFIFCVKNVEIKKKKKKNNREHISRNPVQIFFFLFNTNSSGSVRGRLSWARTEFLLSSNYWKSSFCLLISPPPSTRHLSSISLCRLLKCRR